MLGKSCLEEGKVTSRGRKRKRGGSIAGHAKWVSGEPRRWTRLGGRGRGRGQLTARNFQAGDGGGVVGELVMWRSTGKANKATTLGKIWPKEGEASSWGRQHREGELEARGLEVATVRERKRRRRPMGGAAAVVEKEAGGEGTEKRQTG